MVRVLVGVHRATEREDRAVRLDRPRWIGPPREAPLVEAVATRFDDVREDACARLLAVDDRQNVHQPSPALTGTFADCSRRCSVFAFAAACAMRPPPPSELLELLLKNAYACCAWPESSRSGPTHSRSSSSEYR